MLTHNIFSCKGEGMKSLPTLLLQEFPTLTRCRQKDRKVVCCQLKNNDKKNRKVVGFSCRIKNSLHYRKEYISCFQLCINIEVVKSLITLLCLDFFVQLSNALSIALLVRSISLPSSYCERKVKNEWTLEVNKWKLITNLSNNESRVLIQNGTPCMCWEISYCFVDICGSQ